MNVIKIHKRYPHSRREDIIDAYTRGVTAGANALMDENETLRAERDEWHRVAESKQDIIDHMRDANATNAKLHELVDELWAIAYGYAPDESELDFARDMMRELGIEY